MQVKFNENPFLSLKTFMVLKSKLWDSSICNGKLKMENFLPCSCLGLVQTSWQSLWTHIDLSHAWDRHPAHVKCHPSTLALSHFSSPFQGEMANDCLGNLTLLPQENLLLLLLEVRQPPSQWQNSKQATGFHSFWNNWLVFGIRNLEFPADSVALE